MNFFKCVIFVLITIYSKNSIAQNSIRLQELESYLRKNNLQLLAEQYNIDASKAAIIQSKIWSNPYLSGEFNLINPQDKEFLSVGSSGQKAIAIQQLIKLGGKRKNEVNWAKSNAEIAQLQFEQLLRNLNNQLGQDFYTLYFERKKNESISDQLNELDTLVNAYNIQAMKSNVALKDLVRLQSLQLNLISDKNDLIKHITELEQEIRLITGLEADIIPLVKEDELIAKYNRIIFSKDSLLLLAMMNNPELKSTLKMTENQELFLKWQKSMATPDLTAGFGYDQRGGAFQNQINFTFGIPLNFWNVNKGNIKIAEAQWKQAQTINEFKKQEFKSKIDAAYKNWNLYNQQMNQSLNWTNNSTEVIYESMVTNFSRRNISLMEFTDFMESYTQSVIQINNIKSHWIQSVLELNHLTNLNIFNSK